MGLSDDASFWVYGTFGLFVYLTSIPGGMLADRSWGQKTCVSLGAFVMCAAHFIMYAPPAWCFYTGLFLLAIGSGLFKPNVSIMVGQLYEKGDEKKETGFFIFYMSINIGAFIASIVCGIIAEEWGYHFAFLTAGIIMTLGFMIFVFGYPILKGVGEPVKKGALTQEEIDIRNAPLNS